MVKRLYRETVDGGRVVAPVTLVRARQVSAEGIWTSELYGPFGWTNRGVFVFENGRVIGGDNRQYTMGTYRLNDDNFEAELTVHYYGPPRTMFGETKEQFATRLTGKCENGIIEGSVGRPDKPEYDLQIRLTKRLDLPPTG